MKAKRLLDQLNGVFILEWSRCLSLIEDSMHQCVAMDERKRLRSWWSIVGYKYLYVTNRRKKTSTEIYYRNLWIVANFTVETHFRFENYNWHVTFSSFYIYWFIFLSYLFHRLFWFQLFVKNKRYNWIMIIQCIICEHCKRVLRRLV